jgi:ubiquinone/menaquinone biosynthesis C-methylase UbiE
VAIDCSASLLDLALERAVSLNLHNLTFYELKANHLEELDEPFHAVLCRSGLMFLAWLVPSLKMMRQLLLPGPGGGGAHPGRRPRTLERDPQAVLADVSNDKVTAQHARAAYGVVLDTSGTRVDEAETTRLREQLRRPEDVGGT